MAADRSAADTAAGDMTAAGKAATDTIAARRACSGGSCCELTPDDGAALGCVTGQCCGIDAIGDRARRHRRLVGIAERPALAQGRDAQRIIGAARARTADGGDAHARRRFLDRAGIQARDLGVVPPWLALGQHVMTAAGKSDQRDEDGGADEIPTNSTRHAAENASNSVKDCSMMLRRPGAKECVNHDADQAHRGIRQVSSADRIAASGQIAGFGRRLP